MPEDPAVVVRGRRFEVEHPVGDALEDVAVVGHEQQPGPAAPELLLEPVDRVDVEVVGGLVEDQEVRRRQQGAGEVDAAALPTGHLVGRVLGVEPEPSEQRGGLVGPGRRVRRQDRVDRRGRGQHRVLTQEADAQPGPADHLAVVRRAVAGDDAEEGGLARPVRADQADAVLGGQAEGHVRQEGPTLDGRADAVQGDEVHGRRG